MATWKKLAFYDEVAARKFWQERPIPQEIKEFIETKSEG